MPDQPVADRAAFREAMARAEAASGIIRDESGVETNGIEAILRGETPAPGQDETAPVAVQASDQPLTPEPVTPTDTSKQEQEPQEPVAPPTVEELQAKLAAAEARLSEKDSMIGRQSGEVGELRQTVDSMRMQLAALEARAQAPQAPVAVTPITQELIDERPDIAVQAAYEQKNPHALEIAFASWRALDPFTAAAWLNDRKLEQQEQKFQAQLAEERRLREEATAPVAASQQEAQWAQAINKVKEAYPDILAVDATTGKSNAERLLTEVVEQHPFLKTPLTSGTVEERADALAALYALDKMGDPEGLRKQLAKDAEDAAAEAAAARAAAGVVSSQTNAGQQSDGRRSFEELEVDRYLERQRARPSLARGWTGRTSS